MGKTEAVGSGKSSQIDLMHEYDGITRAHRTQPLIGIYLEAIRSQGLHFVVLVTKINGAVAVLKGPHKRQLVRVPRLTPVRVLGISRPVLAEYDGIVFFTS